MGRTGIEDGKANWCKTNPVRNSIVFPRGFLVLNGVKNAAQCKVVQIPGRMEILPVRWFWGSPEWEGGSASRE